MKKKKRNIKVPVISKQLDRIVEEFRDAAATDGWESDQGSPQGAYNAAENLHEAKVKLYRRLKTMEDKIHNQREYINALLEKRDETIVTLEQAIMNVEMPVEAQGEWSRVRQQLLAISNNED